MLIKKCFSTKMYKIPNKSRFTVLFDLCFNKKKGVDDIQWWNKNVLDGITESKRPSEVSQLKLATVWFEYLASFIYSVAFWMNTWFRKAYISAPGHPGYSAPSPALLSISCSLWFSFFSHLPFVRAPSIVVNCHRWEYANALVTRLLSKNDMPFYCCHQTVFEPFE